MRVEDAVRRVSLARTAASQGRGTHLMTMMATDIGIASRRKVISSRCVRVRKTSRRDEGETCSEGARESLRELCAPVRLQQ